MKKYTKYLSYVLRHKWYVTIECFQRGLYRRGIMHDMSKFRPSEFIPYARYFNGTYQSEKDIPKFLPMSYESILTKEYVEEQFDLAWLEHTHRNKHHWQYWVLREDDGCKKILKMEHKYIMEMVCDWVGAGKAQGNISPKNDKYLETRNWYNENKDKMVLHKNTRREVEQTLGL